MNEDPLQRLFADLKYQIRAPDVTTMAACECGISYSRGGRTCEGCLEKKLEGLVGYGNAVKYVDALRVLKYAQLKHNEHKAK